MKPNKEQETIAQLEKEKQLRQEQIAGLNKESAGAGEGSPSF